MWNYEQLLPISSSYFLILICWWCSMIDVNLFYSYHPASTHPTHPPKKPTNMLCFSSYHFPNSHWLYMLCSIVLWGDGNQIRLGEFEFVNFGLVAWIRFWEFILGYLGYWDQFCYTLKLWLYICSFFHNFFKIWKMNNFAPFWFSMLKPKIF